MISVLTRCLLQWSQVPVHKIVNDTTSCNAGKFSVLNVKWRKG